MAEYWKSTPSYWCKFCSLYVRDTALERKNHEASAKHQNNIQRSLRELHKGHEREQRDKQRAKDEVARLNELVAGKPAGTSSTGKPTTGTSWTSAPPPPPPTAQQPKISSAEQRRLHAQQLAAMGVALPDELKQELSGVGGWQVVSERVVAPEEDSAGRSLADIKREAGESKDDVKVSVDALAQGVHKRKADDDDDGLQGGGGARKKAWGSSLKTYPGAKGGDGDEDAGLDALLSGVSKKVEIGAKDEASEGLEDVKQEDDDQKPITAPVSSGVPAVAQEDAAPSTVVFKKRKGKK